MHLVWFIGSSWWLSNLKASVDQIGGVFGQFAFLLLQSRTLVREDYTCRIGGQRGFPILQQSSQRGNNGRIRFFEVVLFGWAGRDVVELDVAAIAITNQLPLLVHDGIGDPMIGAVLPTVANGKGISKTGVSLGAAPTDLLMSQPG